MGKKTKNDIDLLIQADDKKWKKNKQFKGSKKNYNTEEEIRFSRSLSLIGLEIRHMESDGNCMFRSIADQLLDDQSKHFLFRKKIIDYMEANKDHFSLFMEDDEPFDDYLRRMQTPGEWGGHQELYAASQCLDTSIIVHQQEEDRPRYVLICPDSNHFINISYHGECHYNSVRPIKNGSKSQLEQELCQQINAPRDSTSKEIFSSVPWASERDIEIALEMTHNNVDAAIDFLCVNMNNMDIFRDEISKQEKVDINMIKSGSESSKIESIQSGTEKKRFPKTKSNKCAQNVQIGELSGDKSKKPLSKKAIASFLFYELNYLIIINCIVDCNYYHY